VNREPSLFWIDWNLSRGSVVREQIGRFAALYVVALALLALLLSGGIGRFLATRYAVTAVLREPVSRGDAEGIARKISALPPVRSSEYRDPDAAWKEFLKAYPGLDSLQAAGGNPLPGYIEIRFRHDRLTAADVTLVASVVRPVPYIEKVLAGEDYLPRLLRADRYASALCWAVFGLLLAGTFHVWRLQERIRASALAGDFAFLLDRGVPARRLASSRAAGAAVSALLVAIAGISAAAGTLFLLIRRYPILETVIGPPADFLVPRTAVGAGIFLLCAALLAAGASLLGWRTARAPRT